MLHLGTVIFFSLANFKGMQMAVFHLPTLMVESVLLEVESVLLEVALVTLKVESVSLKVELVSLKVELVLLKVAIVCLLFYSSFLVEKVMSMCKYS